MQKKTKTFLVILIILLIGLSFFLYSFFMNKNNVADSNYDSQGKDSYQELEKPDCIQETDLFFLSLIDNNILLCENQECKDGFYLFKAFMEKNSTFCKKLPSLDLQNSCEAILEKNANKCDAHKECCESLSSLKENNIDSECNDDVLFFKAYESNSLDTCYQIKDEEYKDFCEATILKDYSNLLEKYTICK